MIRRIAAYSPLHYFILFCIALILYLPFRSAGLDDFDSFSFAFALNHYDLTLQQPHPPGFPVYIVLARGLYALTNDQTSALTLLSAISGAVAVTALAWLGSGLKQKGAGFLAAIMLMTLPGFWLLSEIALSDVPGVAITLLALGAIVRGKDDLRWLGVGAFFAGLALGLRPQNGLPIAIFGLYALLPLNRAFIGRFVLVSVIGIFSILLWFVPVASASGGVDQYLVAVRAHSNHVLRVDSLFGQPIILERITTRIEMFGNGLSLLLGKNSTAMILTGLILIIGLMRINYRDKWIRQIAFLLWLWFIAVLAQVFFLESLERPRLYLTFLPPLFLLAIMGWIRLGNNLALNVPNKFRQLVFFPLMLVPVINTLTAFPLVNALSHERSAPEQITDYIRANIPPNSAVVVSLGSLRAAQMNLGEYPQLYLGQFDPAVWANEMAIRQPRYLILLDRDDIWPEAYNALAENYAPIEDRVFQRDPRIFPQHSLVRLQVLSPISDLTPDQMQLPMDGKIIIGNIEAGKYLGEGWYRSEEIAGSTARWTAQEAVIRVALPAKDTRFSLTAAPFGTGQKVEVIVNGKSIGSNPITEVWGEITFEIPADVLADHPISEIILRHEKADIPPGSSRSLSAAYQQIKFYP